MRTRYAILFSIVVFLSLLISTYFVVGKQSSEVSLIKVTATAASGSIQTGYYGPTWWWPIPIPKPRPIPTRRPPPTPRPTPTRRPTPTPRPTPTRRPPPTPRPPHPPPPPIPPFVICPSGVGHSHCYIDWNALFRWLCQHHYLSQNVCRKLGF